MMMCGFIDNNSTFLDKFNVLKFFLANLLPFLGFGLSGSNISSLKRVSNSSQLTMFLNSEFHCSSKAQEIEHSQLLVGEGPEDESMGVLSSIFRLLYLKDCLVHLLFRLQLLIDALHFLMSKTVVLLSLLIARDWIRKLFKTLAKLRWPQFHEPLLSFPVLSLMLNVHLLGAASVVIVICGGIYISCAGMFARSFDIHQIISGIAVLFIIIVVFHPLSLAAQAFQLSIVLRSCRRCKRFFGFVLTVVLVRFQSHPGNVII
ncbi:MAG: hypothetical protein EZS28_008983 [Streblomastix strix]|uniref:Uncharacterized protein n=1 Tax=Streblomastix strix TaxID=222440 RepID=A0A5J4WKF4_9EUKA|nr:MAG: hypothetical protein EZS28_008983 [Streblomastix strix]